MSGNQAVNPFLPGYEYIPDGEPYVFEDRVYLYGSHDKFDGEDFCPNDYVTWSAPANDLSNWRYEGVIYRRDQDPVNDAKRYTLLAPDVQRGFDGRYYLYYAMAGMIRVAVCDTPAGQFEFYGAVQSADGTPLGGKPGTVFQFDPGVLVDDDNRVYLYTGFAPKPDEDSIFHKYNLLTDGAYFYELEPDMLTVKNGPTRLIPGISISEGTGYEGHEFFEASSIRKVNGKYYFVYSSIQGHELCYAVSDHPDGGFTYGGTIVSIGDVGLPNPNDRKQMNYTGNTHGSIVEICGQWYVFYHRQTNFCQCSRQACAEPIFIEKDGSIKQVYITSSGLSGKPLAGKGVYEARIACNLVSRDGAIFYPKHKEAAGIHPYFTQDEPDGDEGIQYIANLQDGSLAGFKYFDFKGASIVTIKVRGSATGTVTVSTIPNGASNAAIAIKPCEEWHEFTAPLTIGNGKQALYFTFSGEGVFDFLSFELR